jgi:hypothetical protein
MWALSCVGAISIVEKLPFEIGFLTEIVVGFVVGWAILTTYTAAVQDISLNSIDKTLAWLDDKGYIDRETILNKH